MIANTTADKTVEGVAGLATRSFEGQVRKPRRIPFTVRVLIGVVAGLGMGLIFRSEPIVAGLRNEDLGDAGMLLIQLLKTLAVPLLFFGILDAFLRTRITAKRGGQLLAICLVNVSVALAIGLTLMNWLTPGKHFHGQTASLVASFRASPPSAAHSADFLGQKPFQSLQNYIPKSPDIITVVLTAILGGAALRRIQDRQDAGPQRGLRILAHGIEAAYATTMQMLQWVIHLVPLAVFGLLAHVVGRAGLAPFKTLWLFLGVILLGMAIHALFYYPAICWLRGGKSPRLFLGGGSDAILTGLSTNSSLATVPVTLKCLTAKMGVSEESARLSACMGTNLNNDGVTLYEAMAALFLAQACGFDLTLGQQAVVVLASLMAGIGIAGVPEAGLIMLPLVLSAAGLPEAVIAAALPLLISVDWVLARVRSGVNVMSDMAVAILLDHHVAGSSAAVPVPARSAAQTTVTTA